MCPRRMSPTSAALRSSPTRKWRRLRWSRGKSLARRKRPKSLRQGAWAGMSCSPPIGKRRSLSTASYLAGGKRKPTSARWARISSFPPEGQTIGGMFTKPPTLPHPFWLYYFNVDDIEAASKRVEAGGGQILYGPMVVPGGAWIVHCTDPQGAIFALLDGPRPSDTLSGASDDPSDARAADYFDKAQSGI